MIAACMGGWCALRDRCPAYHSEFRVQPYERLCRTGQDGKSDVVTLNFVRADPQPPRIAFAPKVSMNTNSRRIPPEIVAANRAKRRAETLAKRKIYDAGRAEAKRVARTEAGNPMKRRASPGQMKAGPIPITFAKPKPVKADKSAAFKSQEAYIPPNVKRTVWLTPPDRFDPRLTAELVFSSMRPGQYL